jgi:hypothetical protein
MSRLDELMDRLRENAQASSIADKLSPPETKSASPLWWFDPPPRDEVAMNALRLWLTAPFDLQRPQGVSFPRFMGQFELADGTGPASLPHIFLMTHNWAAAFAGDHDFDDRASEFRQPAPICCFDFAISGRRVLAFMNESESESWVVVECRTWGWFPIVRDGGNLKRFDIDGPQERAGVTKLRRLLLQNIKAACIALEAEIAETEIVRAPHKLNAARIRRGKLPISDYHIINLVDRRRVTPLPLDHEHGTHRSPRLHFRRGHWRHFVNHKTWIKWTLVGDPDLGFIDKEYRL